MFVCVVFNFLCIHLIMFMAEGTKQEHPGYQATKGASLQVLHDPPLIVCSLHGEAMLCQAVPSIPGRIRLKKKRFLMGHCLNDISK